MKHFPVLLKETIQFLAPCPNENFIDATIGGGGHSLAILEKTKSKGKVLGIDWSLEAIAELEQQKKNKPDISSRLILVADNFINIAAIAHKLNFKPIHGILFDLGLSTDILESKRGFSFKDNEPLDMRYNPKMTDLTASHILNTASEKEIYYILKNFGEEKYSYKIAKTIIFLRQKEPFTTTKQLKIAVIKATKQNFNIKILARVFQALRIVVNKELENLEKALDDSFNILAENGRIVVISYHSLEDRIVKNKFKQAKNFKILTKKPIIPKEEEIKNNPRSRSAKLRAIKK